MEKIFVIVNLTDFGDGFNASSEVATRSESKAKKDMDELIDEFCADHEVEREDGYEDSTSWEYVADDGSLYCKFEINENNLD